MLAQCLNEMWRWVWPYEARACWTSSSVSELRVVSIWTWYKVTGMEVEPDFLVAPKAICDGFLASTCHYVSNWELCLPVSDKGSS